MCDEHGHVHDREPTSIQWGRATLLLGALGLASYFGSVVFHPFPAGASRVLFFAVGPLIALAACALGGFLRAGADSVALRLAVVSHVVGGAMVSAMATVQALHWTVTDAQLAGAVSEAARESIGQIAWSVNNVQAGLDVAWDVWMAVGAALLGLALLSHPLFGRAFGIAGIGVAAAVLGLNLLTFPTAPAEAGLVDLGPLLAAWYAAVLVQVTRAVVRLSRGYAGWPEPALV